MNCPHCKTPAGPPNWKARTTVLWANQHGRKVRLFCGVCGTWTDFTMLYRSDDQASTAGITDVKLPERATLE